MHTCSLQALKHFLNTNERKIDISSHTWTEWRWIESGDSNPISNCRLSYYLLNVNYTANAYRNLVHFCRVKKWTCSSELQIVSYELISLQNSFFVTISAFRDCKHSGLNLFTFRFLTMIKKCFQWIILTQSEKLLRVWFTYTLKIKIISTNYVYAVRLRINEEILQLKNKLMFLPFLFSFVFFDKRKICNYYKDYLALANASKDKIFLVILAASVSGTKNKSAIVLTD